MDWFKSRSWLPAVLSGLALWAAFAPLKWSLLAWIAPLGWVIAIDRPQSPGRSGYMWLWLGGSVFWLLIMQGVRLAFWPLTFGWIALSLYLAVYIPLFIATARVMYHRWRWPLVVSAPLAWIGMETIRGYALTGYPGNALAHSQTPTPLLIQSADQLGAAGIAWVMISVCVAVMRVAQALRSRQFASVAPSLLTASVLFAAMLGYGVWKLREADRLAEQPPILRALLVQENTPSIFDYNPQRGLDSWNSYLELTRSGAQSHGPVDVVIWPESTFTANAPLMESDFTRGLPAKLTNEGYSQEEADAIIDEYRQAFEIRTREVLNAALGPRLPDTPVQVPHLMVGCDYRLFTSEAIYHYNAAILVGPNGQPLDIYNKMHLVMFGEYIPLGILLQWLGDMFGVGSATPGDKIKSFEVAGVRLAPNICFESMISHLISHQVRQLSARGESPDVLCNLTNDSWFRGSSMLDHHLSSTIFVSVENRRPTLVAANTGLTAHIDGSGRVLQVTERMEPATILAEVRLDGRGGLVQSWGYPLGWSCGLLCLFVWVMGLWGKLRPTTSGRKS